MGEKNMTKAKKNAKRFRTKYTKQQLEGLEKLFTTNHYPDPFTVDELADQLELSNDKVAVWFQNRRSKFKRESREAKVNWMREQVYDKENRPPVLSLSQAPYTNSYMFPADKGVHVLSASQNKISVSDDEKPSSNLHYKPSTTSPPSSLDHLNNGTNYFYTPQLQLDFSSCAGDILRESHTTPSKADDNRQSGYYGTLLSSYAHVISYPVPVTPCMYNVGMFPTPTYCQHYTSL